MPAPNFLSKGIDYLGDLGAKLRDLQGFKTLIHELIQNADDAETASSMTFSVGDEDLIVDNDGVFSECPDVTTEECAWKHDGIHNYRCDFHRFRRVASGDKRGQEGTTGAFGIGFIAVYQITDEPELISRGHHWKLHENRPESERIEVCRGCSSCRQPGLPGTRFIFPWAKNPESEMRRRLGAEAVPADSPDRFLRELRVSLPTAMLFLKRLREIAVFRNGERVQRLERLDDGDSLILSSGEPEADQVWHIIKGDFAAAADQLRTTFPGKIEEKRSPAVKLAISATEPGAGLLCACLPTEQDVGLPFHLNADFYTSNDRKRIILAEDYQSKWNREAIKAAALALGDHVARLLNLIGHKPFWAMMERLHELASGVERGRAEPVLADFWKYSLPVLQTKPVIWTSTGEWATVAQSCLLLQKDEAEALEVLEALNLRVTHEDLRPHHNLLRSKAVGVPVLDVHRISQALSNLGLEGRKTLSEFPPGLRPEARRKLLWKELGLLLDRRSSEGAKDADARQISKIALAPGRDEALWPCEEIFRADPDTISLFGKLELGIPFLKEEPDFPPQLAQLCRPFDVQAAIEVLDSDGKLKLEELWSRGRLPLPDLFAWFENEREQILSRRKLKEVLASLPLFPSAGRLRPLTDLLLPGNFDDPLHVADLVDLSVVGDRKRFLRDLGARDLNFPQYACSVLPRVLADPALSSGKKREAVLLLATRLGEVKEDDSVRHALRSCDLVECRDHRFRQAALCYFDEQAVQDCLGDSASIAVLPKMHRAAVRDLYEWLGVASQPRLEDIVARIRKLTEKRPSPDAKQQVQRIFAHLGKSIKENEEDCFPLEPLKGIRWLPARGKADRWYAPDELYADYQAHLFESQALILDLPNPDQRASKELLVFLGVHLTPEPALVVKHLLHHASLGVAVNTGVYNFLNDKAGDPALAQLRGKACLWLGDAYRSPDELFWGEHPFGRYRWRLGDQLKDYARFLRAIGVREAPDNRDFLNVIRQISEEFGAAGKPLDGEAHSVLMACWRGLSQALLKGTISSSELQALHDVRCIPDKAGLLNRPDWMFFENRAGLADKFGSFLLRNVIPRPLDTGDALATAGVRPLGTAVVVDPLKCRNRINDPELRAHILSRRNEIARVLDAPGAEGGTSGVLERLTKIQCCVAESIKIRYRLSAFDQERNSDPEHVPALYLPAENSLVYAQRDDSRPWASIARELAIALYPDDDPGRFAAGLKEVLAAQTPEAAAAVLDELGYARLDTRVPPPVVSGNTVDGLGTGTTQETAGSQKDEPPRESPNSKSSEDGHSRPFGPAAPTEAPSENPPSDDRPTGGGTASGGLGSKGTSPPGSGQPADPTPIRPPGARRRFISYVAVEPDEKEPDPDTIDSQQRKDLEEAAISYILRVEPQLRRMPDNNPGFDLFEPDEQGQPRRWVEVKAMTEGLWDRPVGMTYKQFSCAQQHGKAFWLYVVELAGTPEARILRIQDPAGKARTFTFDEGWREVAEIDGGKNEQRHEEQESANPDQWQHADSA